MAAFSFESPFFFFWSPAFALPLPFPLPVGAPPAVAGATVPSGVRTPQPAAGAGFTGGAWATRLARSAARSSVGVAGLAASGAAGAAGGVAAGGWYTGVGWDFFGIGMGGTEKLAGVTGRAGATGAGG